MSCINTVPREVLGIMFSYLSRPDIHQCLYVCRLWNLIATPEYFKEINLTKKMLTFLRRKSLLDYRLKYKVPKKVLPHAEHVLRLKILIPDEFGEIKEDTTIKELFVILCHMFNIVEIDVSEIDYFLFEFFAKLKQISLGKLFGYSPLKGLQRIRLPSFEDDFHPIPEHHDDYYFICFQYALSITHLEIHLFPSFNTVISLSTGHLSIEDFLSSFPNLTNLEIYGISDHPGSMKKRLSRSIFKTCPRLTSLKIVVDCSYYIYDRGDDIKAIRNGKTALELLNNYDHYEDNHITKNQCYFNLEKLDLDLYTESAEELYNFISPHKKLKSLNLKVRDKINIRRWWYEKDDRNAAVSTSGMYKLLNVLNSIPLITLNIEDFATDYETVENYEEGDRQGLIDSSKATLEVEANLTGLGHYSNYYHVMNDFLTAFSANNSQRVCKLVVRFGGSFTTLSVEIEESGQLSIYCSQREKFRDSKIQSFLSVFFDSDIGNSNEESHRHLRGINYLTLQGLSYVNEGGIDSMDTIIEQAVAKCPRLFEVELFSREPPHRFTIDRFGARNYVERNSLYFGLSDNNYTSEEENKKVMASNSSSSFFTRNLKELVYMGYYFPPSPILLESIMNLKITHLNIKSCYFPKDQHGNIELDFRELFPNLDCLMLEIVSDYELRYEHSTETYYFNHYLHLEYANATTKTRQIKACYYRFIGTEEERSFPESFNIANCSKVELYQAKLQKNVKVSTLKLPHTLKTLKIFSKRHYNSCITL